MESSVDGTITCFFRQLREGDQAAAEKLWDHFFPRLLGLAQKTLACRPQRMADAEDAVQSAFFSFWQSATAGHVHADVDRDGLWSLLSVITVRKALKQVRKERTQKRGGGRVLGEASVEASLKALGRAPKFDEAVGELPAHEFDIRCEELLLSLDEDSRALAILRLMGYKHQEIAEILDCTERTIRRKIKLIKLTWEQADGDAE